MDGGPSELIEVQALVDREQYADALKALGPLRRTAANSPDVWRLQALALRGAGELNEAQMAADRWGSLASDAPEVLRLKADLLSQRGKHYAAAEVAGDLTALRPDDAEAFFQLARYQRDAGLLPRARTSIQRSLELDRTQWQSYELAGLIEVASAQPALAVTYFQKALRLDPDNGRLAEHLQRAIGNEQEKAAGAKKAASMAKQETKARAKDLHAADKAEAKRRRKVENELSRGTGRRKSSVVSVITLVAVLGTIGFVAYLYRPNRDGGGASPSVSTSVRSRDPANGVAVAVPNGETFTVDGTKVTADVNAMVLGTCIQQSGTRGSQLTLQMTPCTSSHNAEVALIVPNTPARDAVETPADYLTRICTVDALKSYAPSLETTYPAFNRYKLNPKGPGTPTWCLVEPWGPDGTGTQSIRGQ